MDIYGKTDIGKIRDNNQDNFYYEKLNSNLSFALVCDGMGAQAAGALQVKLPLMFCALF